MRRLRPKLCNCKELLELKSAYEKYAFKEREIHCLFSLQKKIDNYMYKEKLVGLIRSVINYKITLFKEVKEGQVDCQLYINKDKRKLNLGRNIEKFINSGEDLKISYSCHYCKKEIGIIVPYKN
jgi:hypothetical protein